MSTQITENSRVTLGGPLKTLLIGVLLLAGPSTASWATSIAAEPPNLQAACRGFECVKSAYAAVVDNGSMVATNFTPAHFLLFGMALIVLRVVGKKVARIK